MAHWAISVMLATFIDVLDTSVANVRPPHIAEPLSINEESTWVLTSYLISNAVVRPSHRWLGARSAWNVCSSLHQSFSTRASLLCGTVLDPRISRCRPASFKRRSAAVPCHPFPRPPLRKFRRPHNRLRLAVFAMASASPPFLAHPRVWITIIIPGAGFFDSTAHLACSGRSH